MTGFREIADADIDSAVAQWRAIMATAVCSSTSP
jgi:hypothetical protein